MSAVDHTRDEMLERPLPHSAEAERAILGAIIIDNSVMAQAADLLVADDFYQRAHRMVFSAMLALSERGAEINPILVGEELRREGCLEQAGGVAFVSELTYGLPHFSNIAAYARVVKGKALRRAVVKVDNLNTSQALEEEEDDWEFLDEVEARVYAIRDEYSSTHTEAFTRAGVLAASGVHQAQEIQASGRAVTGLTTGFNDLDAKLLGLHRDDLVIVAGRPSMGKTAFALCLAQNAAMQAGARVAVFSLEMSKQSLVNRMLCSEARIDQARFRAGYMTPDEWTRLGQAQEVISPLEIFIDDTPAISVAALRRKARRLVARLPADDGGRKRLDLIIVDYLQLMSGRDRRVESRQQEVSQISRDLKAAAKEFNVPLVALSQLSRASETRSDHRPQLSDLRESGAIEQDADVVAFVFREEEYHRTDENVGRAEIIVAKQRNGPTGPVELAFLKEFTRFETIWNDNI